MSIKTKVILITLLFGIPAFLTGRSIWPPAPGPMPTAGQIPFFIVLSVMESLLFGLGIAFIIFGWSALKKIAKTSHTLTTLTFVAIAWMLVSWWPHDNLHMHTGMDFQGLLYIEYGFHATLMLAALVVAYYFLTAIKQKGVK